MYWLTRVVETKKICIIQVFDFTAENFGKVGEVMFEEEYLFVSISSFRGNRLSLLLQYCGAEDIEIWVSSCLSDDKVSWIRVFKVSDLYIPTIVSI